MTINFIKNNDNAVTPSRGSQYAAGYDLYSPEFKSILPHQTIMIDTGIAIEIPEGYFGAIFARSGLASKKGLAPANKVGVIDCDYRGNICVALHNHSEDAQSIDRNDRIAQLVIMPYANVDFIEVDELSKTVRGEGGFGSTGT